MKRFVLFIFFNSALCIVHCASAQNPLVKMWDKKFGGTDRDELYFFQQTTDGGFILGGLTNSGISGDKTQATWGNNDYWILKIDSLGNKLWDKDFGGLDLDALKCLQQTSDGGYILGGISYSGISGNKFSSSRGSADYWIVKTDSLGNRQWDKDFGGSDFDYLQSIAQTSDGGFILGGLSYSGIGMDKTQATWGACDYWMIKTDSLGNQLWDKDFGGTDVDYLQAIQQLSDGGFILGGYSNSGIGGDKIQPTIGFEDYWIVKTDSLGNKQWDKDFGGADIDFFCSMQQTSDDGFILGGYSQSGIGGDKTQPTWGSTAGDNDYWIIKTDSLGNKQWDKDFGGTNLEDEYGSVKQTSDRGYLLTGTSYSPISGDKTDDNLGFEQTWVIKIDSVGNKMWDRTIKTTSHDEQGLSIQTRDGCYLIGNYNDGGAGGDKSQSAWNGSMDFWMIKFCETIHIIFTSQNHLCPGTCASFMNLTTGATSYHWSFYGATPDTSMAANPTNICYQNPGTYDVQLIASNANGSDTLLLVNYITVYPASPPQSITQNGDTLFAIAGSSSYQWYFNTTLINGATDYFYVAPASGDYNVVATDGNGCEVEAAVFNVIASVDAIGVQDFLIFPNPVGDKVKIQKLKVTSETAVEISIYNVLGEKIYATTCVEPLTVNCEPFPSGLYYIEITSSGKTLRSKFVKSTYR